MDGNVDRALIVARDVMAIFIHPSAHPWRRRRALPLRSLPCGREEDIRDPRKWKGSRPTVAQHQVSEGHRG